MKGYYFNVIHKDLGTLIQTFQPSEKGKKRAEKNLKKLKAGMIKLLIMTSVFYQRMK